MDEIVVIGEGEGFAPIDGDLAGMEGAALLHDGMRRRRMPAAGSANRPARMILFMPVAPARHHRAAAGKRKRKLSGRDGAKKARKSGPSAGVDRAAPQAYIPAPSDAGWSSPVARQAHNLKVTGSNPVPATIKKSPARSRAFFMP